MPLHLHNNDTMEPNNAWQWLERWSSFKFWEPLPQPKKASDKKSYNKKGNIQTKKAELGRQKKVEGWVSTLNNRRLLSDHSPANENQTNKITKLGTREESAGQEQPKNELERVKQNLRRISASSKVGLACSESVAETPKLIPKTVSSSPTPDVPEKSVDKKPFQNMVDPSMAEFKSLGQDQVDLPSKTVETKDKFDKLYDDFIAVEKHPLESVEKAEDVDVPKEDEERIYEEDKTSVDFQFRSNGKNVAGKLECPEFVSQRRPSLPNYMAATESAKAKLRGFSSPRVEQDEVENGGIQRRHSLPLSTDRKFSLMSSQNGRLVQATAKGDSGSPLSSTNGHGNNNSTSL